MNQKYEVKENEGGILELYVNNHPCVCPFAGQTVFPIQSKIVGQMDIQVFTKKCDSLCPLFEYKPVDASIERSFESVHLNCGSTYVSHDIEFVPYKKKSNLSIH